MLAVFGDGGEPLVCPDCGMCIETRKTGPGYRAKGFEYRTQEWAGGW